MIILLPKIRADCCSSSAIVLAGALARLRDDA
jgi:hypothetical protein